MRLICGCLLTLSVWAWGLEDPCQVVALLAKKHELSKYAISNGLAFFHQQGVGDPFFIPWEKNRADPFALYAGLFIRVRALPSPSPDSPYLFARDGDTLQYLHGEIGSTPLIVKPYDLWFQGKVLMGDTAVDSEVEKLFGLRPPGLLLTSDADRATLDHEFEHLNNVHRGVIVREQRSCQAFVERSEISEQEAWQLLTFLQEQRAYQREYLGRLLRGEDRDSKKVLDVEAEFEYYAGPVRALLRRVEKDPTLRRKILRFIWKQTLWNEEFNTLNPDVVLSGGWTSRGTPLTLD